MFYSSTDSSFYTYIHSLYLCTYIHISTHVCSYVFPYAYDLSIHNRCPNLGCYILFCSPTSSGPEPQHKRTEEAEGSQEVEELRLLDHAQILPFIGFELWVMSILFSVDPAFSSTSMLPKTMGHVSSTDVRLVHIHGYTHTHLPTHMHAWMHACMHAYIYMIGCVHRYMRIYVHTYQNTYILTYVRTYEHTYVTYIYICTYVPTSISYTHPHMYLYVCVYIYIHLCISICSCHVLSSLCSAPGTPCNEPPTLDLRIEFLPGIS